jgi:hypothetical protein
MPTKITKNILLLISFMIAVQSFPAQAFYFNEIFSITEEPSHSLQEDYKNRKILEQIALGIGITSVGTLAAIGIIARIYRLSAENSREDSRRPTRNSSAYPATINNLGSCYLNATLSALLTSTPVLQPTSQNIMSSNAQQEAPQVIASGNMQSPINKSEHDIGTEFLHIAKQVKTKQNKSLHTQTLHRMINKELDRDENAEGGEPGHTFFILMHSMLKMPKLEAQRIAQLFFHTKQQTRYCLDCKQAYYIGEKTPMAFLSIEDNHGNTHTSLYQCIEKEYERKAHIIDSSYCYSCHQQTRQEQRDEKLQNTPKIFTLRLDIWPQGQEELSAHKHPLHDIAIAKELDLSHFSDNHKSSLYDLKAFIVYQYQPEVDYGHACTYSKIHDIWYRIDDERVTKVTEEHINRLLKKNTSNTTPYIFFYEKRN